MKATKYILALALILGLVSCQPETFTSSSTVADSESVAVVFNVQFPEPIPVSTKGTMGDGPLASEPFEIHLCLYGPGDGYVQNWITATHLTESTTTIDGHPYITGGTFKTFLPITDEKRTIHFIANPPDAVNPTTDDYLDNVMEKMVTQDNTCSYWQELILEHGIHANTTGSVDSQSGLPMGSPELIAEFADIRLLRNFAKIVVEGPSGAVGDDEAIQVMQWTLINVPKKGYVAPYTGDASNRFPKGYLNAYLQTVDGSTAEGVEAWWKKLTGTEEGQDNYLGSMPNDAKIIDDSFPGEPDEAAAGVYKLPTQAMYMYERPKPTTSQAQTAVLVQIQILPDHALYDPHTDESLTPEELEKANTYWYKIEVLNDKGQYFPILRDFVFTLHIKDLTETGAVADDGEHTAKAAFDGPYFGNISASLETAGLSDLSNGESAIHVDQLDYIYMSVQKDGDEILPIQLMRDETTAAQFYFTPNVNYPDEVFYKTTAGVCTISFEVVSVAGFENYPAVVDGSVVGGASGELTFTPYDIDESHMRKSIIRVKGVGAADGSKELYRDILITLMSKPSLTHVSELGLMTTTAIVSAHGVADIKGVNKPVDLRIALPEGLSSSMFPIQIRIEAEKNTLSATSQKLPVATGKSYYDNTRNTFYYIYTINYSDYCSLNPRTKKYEYKYVFGATETDRIRFFTNKTDTESSDNNSTKIHVNDLAGQFTPVDLGIGSETPTTEP